MRRTVVALVLGLGLTACGTDRRWDPDRDRGMESERGEPAHEGELPTGIIARWAQRLGPDGRIADGALMNMKAQRDALLVRQRAWPSRSAATASGGPVAWQWLGPGNIGGRIRAIAVAPGQPGTMWIGAAGGGIWKTTDGGQSWAPQNDFLPVLPVGCLVVAPNDPNKLYAGTGEGVFDSVEGSSVLAAPRGAGIFVSADAGQTWNQLPSTSGSEWYFVNRLSFDPNNPSIMLAATRSGIWRTTDAGATWSKRLGLDTFDVEYHPIDSMKAIAGTGTGLAFYTRDGGLSWTAATATSTAVRVEVAYARSAPSTVYANISNADRISLYKSVDGGVNYNQVGTSTINTYSRYNSALWVDPTDPNTLMMGGVMTHRSVDGGQTLQQISSGIHPDIHFFVEADGYGNGNKRLYCSDDGGIHTAADITAPAVTWQSLNHQLGISQFYGAAINSAGVVLGGLQDNGTLRYNGGTESWSMTFGGDGGFAAADPTDPNYFYGEVQGLSIFRSRDGGFRAGYIYNAGANPIVEATPNFISPFILDPNDPRIMLAGGAKLWRCRNVKANTPAWFPIKAAVPNTARGGLVSSHYAVDPPRNISAIAVAEGDSDLIWVGHNNGRLYRTANGGTEAPIWTRVDTNPPGLPDRWISRIAIDPVDHNRVWVTLQGYEPDNLWRTDDGGQSWVRVMGNPSARLPAAPLTSIALHRRFPHCLYVGSDIGVFWSADDGATWATSNEGSGTAPVDELVWKNDRQLMVVTHGRGVYIADTAPAATVTAVGSPCGGAGGPVLTASPPRLGGTQSYQLAQAAPNAPVTLLLGSGPASALPLGGGCALQVPLPIPYVVPAGSTGAAGTWQLAFPLPADKSAVGLSLVAQALVQANGGPLLSIGELSGGLEMTLGL